MATCFGYNEPSPGQKQNKVLVHSMIVHCVGSHIVYIFNYIIVLVHSMIVHCVGSHIVYIFNYIIGHM